MKIVHVTLLVLLLGLLLAACAPSGAAAPVPAPASRPVNPQPVAPAAPAPAVTAAAAPAKAAWEVEWEKTLHASKSEGTLVFLTSIGAESRRLVTDTFAKKYGIAVEIMGGQPLILAAKIAAEQRAGIYSADVWVTGTAVQATLRPLSDPIDPMLILPDVTQPDVIKKTWYLGQLDFPTQDHKTLYSGMMRYDIITVNTALVKPVEIATYADLLNPKWKGKISLGDPRTSGTRGLLWFGATQELKDIDVNYMRELLKQDLYITRDSRLQDEWLAQGKHAIGIGTLSNIDAEFMRLGAALKWANVGTPYVTGGTTAIFLLKRAPHPSTASVFINWLLSQEGQTLHSQAIGAQSQRLDVPTGHLQPEAVLKPGQKAFKADTEEFTQKRDTYYVDLAKQIFGP